MTIKVAILIPLYNHGGTVRDVAQRALRFCPDVWVIDDGSTDGGLKQLADLPVHCIRLERNAGKGVALMTGAAAAYKAGFSHIISLDADAQHYPEDIPLFFAAIEKNPYAFIVGARDFSSPNIPRSSRFGRKFSQFWMFVQTGCRVDDMQSGFRAYPLASLFCLSLKEQHYSFEIEVLVYAAWAGFAIHEVPIHVYYQEKGQRISHFRTFVDNLRISLLNTRLTIRALIPIPFKHHALNAEGGLSLLSPLHSLRLLLPQASPYNLAFSAACAMAICTLPLLGLQSILLLFCINWLQLNRLCALAVVPLSWPPLLPGICILLGYRLWHGQWLTEFSLQTLGYEVGQRFFEWVLGSLVLMPLLAIGLGLCVWALAAMLAISEKNRVHHEMDK